MEWITENWGWVLFGVVFIAFHFFGHGHNHSHSGNHNDK
ncbi:hypothetical protein VMF7928_01253 [Vibrio marisflavi CECT 7928]|uniref:DUF2933 domain-containing protein n=1 Tax=Vibrio marisflavi CECT 7928 TaxID=634439 RepID=A0ABN8E0D2_9VIBR|nr:hypothetical protein VMF7928_01253 [Vibrio marisflavi CECT 7928]